tara:strand:- start:1469 stop:1666 length:198 start_codon:yes stop_codon:yes gene_type:complete
MKKTLFFKLIVLFVFASCMTSCGEDIVEPRIEEVQLEKKIEASNSGVTEELFGAYNFLDDVDEDD